LKFLKQILKIKTQKEEKESLKSKFTYWKNKSHKEFREYLKTIVHQINKFGEKIMK